MQDIVKFSPVIILVIVSIVLFLGEEYVKKSQDKFSFIVEHRVHLAFASVVCAVIYYIIMFRNVKKPIDENYDEYLPSYNESNMSYSL